MRWTWILYVHTDTSENNMSIALNTRTSYEHNMNCMQARHSYYNRMNIVCILYANLQIIWTWYVHDVKYTWKSYGPGPGTVLFYYLCHVMLIASVLSLSYDFNMFINSLTWDHSIPTDRYNGTGLSRRLVRWSLACHVPVYVCLYGHYSVLDAFTYVLCKFLCAWCVFLKCFTHMFMCFIWDSVFLSVRVVKFHVCLFMCAVLSLYTYIYIYIYLYIYIYIYIYICVYIYI